MVSPHGDCKRELPKNNLNIWNLDEFYFMLGYPPHARIGFVWVDNLIDSRSQTATVATCYPIRGHGRAFILTHWGQVTHICFSKLTIIGSDSGLSLGRHQAIIWTNVWILLVGPLETTFCEISIEIHIFLSKKHNWMCRLRNVGHIVSASMW